MTKLMEWLLFATIFFGIWGAIVTGNSMSSFTIEWQQAILFSPLILLFVFGLYAAAVVFYRVFTFNNCENAAIELQEQIEEARKDLESKGICLKKKEAVKE